jgi:hypothetical protein
LCKVFKKYKKKPVKGYSFLYRVKIEYWLLYNKEVPQTKDKMATNNSFTTSSREYFAFLNRVSEQFKTEGCPYKELPLDEVIIGISHTYGSLGFTIKDLIDSLERGTSNCGGVRMAANYNWLFVSPKEEKYRKDLEEANKELEEIKKQRDDVNKQLEEEKKEKEALYQQIEKMKAEEKAKEEASLVCRFKKMFD